MVRLLFEDLVLLLVAEFIALAVVLALHRRRFTPESRRTVWITLGVCAVMLMLQFAVVTDRERLRSLVVELVDAVDEGDLSTIENAVHPDGVRIGMGVDADNVSKLVFVQGCNIGLQINRIDEAQVGISRVEVGDGEATVDFRVNCELRSDRWGEARSMPSEWRIRCMKTPEGWKMRQILIGELGIQALVNAPKIALLGHLKEMIRRAENTITP